MTQPQNEYYMNGKQIFELYDVGNLTPVSTTSIDASGFDVNGSAESWQNTHTTVTRTKSICGLSNPEILAVKKAVLVVNDVTTPTASVGIESDITGGVGTYYGMNLFNNNDTDFSVTSTFPYEGSVVFKQEGVGSDPTTTSIKQGTITLNDGEIPSTTTIDPSLLSFSDGTDTTSFNQDGITTTADLTLDIGADLILNGTITETTAGGFTGQYLKIIINGTSYKLQLLAD